MYTVQLEVPQGVQAPLVQDQTSVCVRRSPATAEEGHSEQEAAAEEPGDQEGTAGTRRHLVKLPPAPGRGQPAAEADTPGGEGNGLVILN